MITHNPKVAVASHHGPTSGAHLIQPAKRPLQPGIITHFTSMSYAETIEHQKKI